MIRQTIVSFLLLAVLLPIPGYSHPRRAVKHHAKTQTSKQSDAKQLFYSDALEGRVNEYNIYLMSANMDAEGIRMDRDSIASNPDDTTTNAKTTVEEGKSQIELVKDLATAQRMLRVLTQDKRLNKLYGFGSPYHFADVYPDTVTEAMRANIITMPLVAYPHVVIEH